MRILVVMLFLYGFPCSASSMKSVRESGSAFCKFESTKAICKEAEVKPKDLLPEEMKDKVFDAKSAREDVNAKDNPSSEIVEFITNADVMRNARENKNFHEDELFFKRSEEIASQTGQKRQEISTEAQSDEFSIYQCREAGQPILMTVERTLNVNTNQKVKRKSKTCLGHEEIKSVKIEGSYEESITPIKDKMDKNPTIKSFDIQFLKISHASSSYIVRITWKHTDNTEGCDHFRSKDKKEESSQEFSEEWVYNHPDLWTLSKSSDSSIVEQVCLDNSPKIINGNEVKRSCWKERISFFHQFPKTKECDGLKNRLCEQVNQQCIKPTLLGCAMWEYTFHCFDKIMRKKIRLDLEQIEGTDIDDYDVDYTPNQSFSEVATKLMVFEEVKKEMENSKLVDATKIEIFKGNKMSCSKSVAEDLMYDCCFRYSGLAKQMNLTHCNADEIGLADMRENGLCHYVGSYEEKFLDLWKSRDEHVFCCFPSKLARIVHEEGRDQINMKWGKAEAPNCGGFTIDELSKINFSRMDLSEMYEDVTNKLPEDMPARIQAFKGRLEQDIENAEHKK